MKCDKCGEEFTEFHTCCKCGKCGKWRTNSVWFSPLNSFFCPSCFEKAKIYNKNGTYSLDTSKLENKTKKEKVDFDKVI